MQRIVPSGAVASRGPGRARPQEAARAASRRFTSALASMAADADVKAEGGVQLGQAGHEHQGLGAVATTEAHVVGVEHAVEARPADLSEQGAPVVDAQLEEVVGWAHPQPDRADARRSHAHDHEP